MFLRIMKMRTLFIVGACLLQYGSSLPLQNQMKSYDSGYVITTPRKWFSNGLAQVCVYLIGSESVATGGSITVTLNKNYDQGFGGQFGSPVGAIDAQPEKEKDLITPKNITLEPGMSELCDTILVPVENDRQVNMKVEGKLGNMNVTYNKPITIGKELLSIFVQTDKFLYKPGQKIQFRILSVTGPFLKISNTSYDKIWIESPSGSRLAQWLNHDNSDRLIHQEFQLAEEPEEGAYKIHVKQGKTSVFKAFKVEEFVLPRYEVTIKPPKYILGTDEKFYFTICAKYTYGAPVKGNLSLTLDNSGGGPYKVVITKTYSISGCKDIEIIAEDMKINFEEYYVYKINATATVVEEGTGVEVKESVTASVYRTAISFKNRGKEKYMKPSLPFTGKVKAEFPDGSPAVNETMSVCLGERCKNISTDVEGLLTFIVPAESPNTVQMKAINYPRIKSNDSNWRSIMYKSSHYYYRNLVFSPSNSALIIRPPLGTLCTGNTSNITFPIMFATNSTSSQPKANLYIQVVSRGQIQFNKSEEVEFVPGDLQIEEEFLLAPLKPSIKGIIKGLLNITLELPATVSPKAKIIVWYVREDKEVIADTQEVEMHKCLTNDVGLSWSKLKGQPGEQTTLTLSAEPNSVCSLGVVDKSVELLSSDKHDLTIDRVFDMVESAMINEYENTQSNDYDYCKKKHKKPEISTPRPVDGPTSLPPRPVLQPSPPIPDFLVEETFEPALEEEMDGRLLDNEDEIRQKRALRRPSSYYSDYSDALKMFDISGLYILSDLTVETRPCEQRGGSIGPPPRLRQVTSTAFFGAAGPVAAARPSAAVGTGAANVIEEQDVQDTKARSYFPETWLWDLSMVYSGKNKQQLILPDTITEWVGKAVCVHPQQGLGFSSHAAITTFTPFFVDLTLPPTVKRGELLPVKISVFNYENQDLPVKIILEPSEEYEIVSEEGKQPSEAGNRSSCVTSQDKIVSEEGKQPSEAGIRSSCVTSQDKIVSEEGKQPSEAGNRSSCVTSQDKTVHSIKIRPTALGDVNITVAATVDEAFSPVCGGKSVVSKRDLLIKPITVEAEGFPREKTWTKYICSNELVQWNVEAPTEIVPDSARGWVTAAGDLLGPTLENLGSLVRMPYGCGEQNMLNFAPNIFILQYLDASNQTTKEIKKKATDYMRKGYKRELKYRHKDGSFSAFGASDVSGSTWLTAFVLKSFAQARQFIEIDEDDIQMSLNWLKLRQQDNGCFESVGKVFHKGMKGGIAGSSSPVPLTAYVLISLLEAGESGSSRAITEAAYCLQADKFRDPYTQALKAYALSLANFPEAQSTVDTLLRMANEDSLRMANEDSLSISWEVATTVGKSQSVAVETAGYAILAMMTLDAEKYNVQSRKVVKWISSQRNGQGGFISTQDTVVALQAMASFEAIQDQGPIDMIVDVWARYGQSVYYQFIINEENKLLQQMVTLPSIPTKVFLGIHMYGPGCALLQAVLRYNVPDPDASEAFSMNVSAATVPDRKCNTKNITMCASYLLPDGKSNMVLIEFKLISGYIPEKADLKHIVGNSSDLIKRYEVDGNLVTFYVDELSSKDICISFRVTRDIDVEDAKPGTVRVYDYYQTEFSVSKSYTFPPNDTCLIIRDVQPF